MGRPKAKSCPHCGGPAAWEDNPYHPFCCERCKLIDLGNWAAEKYRIPDRRAGDDEIEKEMAKDSSKGKVLNR
jgi:endogenous inhibitor of DNA gyrase (YacG/DUF329 family)